MDKKTEEPGRPQEPIKTGVIPRQKIISWTIFIPTIAIVLISLITVIFPALIVRTSSPLQDQIFKPDVVDSFMPGILAVPFFVINIIILIIGIIHYKKSKGIILFKSILDFELSKKRAIITLVIILAIFAAVMAPQILHEESWEDYKKIKDRVDTWKVSDFANSLEPHVKYFFLSASLYIFGNIRVIPFIASIILVALTYFFTLEITQNRFAGIVSALLLVQSNVFLSYGTTSTYDNIWILLYLFSLYLIYKKWPPSLLSYVLSILAKPLTISYLPMSLFFIARSDRPRKTKIYSIVSYCIIIAVFATVAIALKTNFGVAGSFDGTDFWNGFTALAIQMRFDYVILIFLLPLTVMLFFASRRGVLHADTILFFMLVILISAPLLLVFTNQTNQPYRWVSLSVFFAIGVGVLLSRRTRQQAELSSKLL